MLAMNRTNLEAAHMTQFPFQSDKAQHMTVEGLGRHFTPVKDVLGASLGNCVQGGQIRFPLGISSLGQAAATAKFQAAGASPIELDVVGRKSIFAGSCLQKTPVDQEPGILTPVTLTCG